MGAGFAVTVFLAMLLVSAAYYLAASLYAPRRRRRGLASRPYSGGGVDVRAEEPEQPYPWPVLVFACVEAAVAAAWAAGWPYGFVLGLALLAAPLVAGGALRDG